jgi:hypothetical protein
VGTTFALYKGRLEQSSSHIILSHRVSGRFNIINITHHRHHLRHHRVVSVSSATLSRTLFLLPIGYWYSLWI